MGTRNIIRSTAWLGVLMAGLISSGACAEPSAGSTRKEPVYLEADEVGYNQQTSVVEALGHVEITQGQRVVFADRVTYSQDSNIVTASGNVSSLEADGTVYFAEALEFKDDMSSGIIQNFRARLKDNSLFAAREAHKIDEQTTLLHHAVYSPCNVCKNAAGEDQAPMWQIKAKDAKIDNVAQKISYRDAYFEVYGVPIFYTPYYSTPTPDSPSKSGLLTPEYSHDNNMGTVIRAPLFLSFAPNADSLITPIYTSLGPVLSAEFRHLTTQGRYELSGSITDPDERDATTGQRIPGEKNMRGHIQGKGDLYLDDTYGWGFNFKRATDDTYLRLYRFGYEDVLTSQVYVDRASGRNYASLQALSFQGLAQTDNPDTVPDAIPLLAVHAETDPLWWRSRFFVSGNAYSLERNVGDDSSRVSATTGWRLPYVSRGGQIYSLAASIRADQYTLHDAPLGAGNFDGSVGRVIPEVSLQWRYPLIKPFAGGGSFTLEPTMNAAFSAARGPDEKLPNEDSALSEFSDINLFSLDRFTGYDQVETGPRVNYGVRGDYDINGNSHLLFLLGQGYQENGDNTFPLGDKAGLHFSDIIGQVGLSYDALDINYRFRLNDQEWINKRNELAAHYAGSKLNLDMGYVSLDDEVGIPNQEQIFGSGALQFYKDWWFTSSARYDIRDSAMRDSSVGVIFHNECVTITTLMKYDFFEDRDIKSGNSFIVRVGLKDLE